MTILKCSILQEIHELNESTHPIGCLLVVLVLNKNRVFGILFFL